MNLHFRGDSATAADDDEHRVFNAWRSFTLLVVVGEYPFPVVLAYLLGKYGS